MKTVTITPTNITLLYLDQIANDTGLTGAKLIRYVIKQYYVIQYGEEAHRKVREEYIRRQLASD